MLELAEQLALGDGAVVHAWEEAVIDPFLHRLGQHDDALVALEELLEVWPPAPIMAPMGGPHLADPTGGRVRDGRWGTQNQISRRVSHLVNPSCKYDRRRRAARPRPGRRLVLEAASGEGSSGAPAQPGAGGSSSSTSARSAQAQASGCCSPSIATRRRHPQNARRYPTRPQKHPPLRTHGPWPRDGRSPQLSPRPSARMAPRRAQPPAQPATATTEVAICWCWWKSCEVSSCLKRGSVRPLCIMLCMRSRWRRF